MFLLLFPIDELLYSSKKINPSLDINNYYIKNNIKPEIGYKKFIGLKLGSLILVDSLNSFIVEQKKHSAANYYYYMLLDTTSYYSMVFIYDNEEKGRAFQLLNFNKKWVKLGEAFLSGSSGDGGCFEHSNSKFINDTTIIREDKIGCFDFAFKDVENDSALIDEYIKSRIILKKNGCIEEYELENKKNYRELYYSFDGVKLNYFN